MLIRALPLPELAPLEASDDGAGRDVPFTDVVELEDVPVLVLVFDNTVEDGVSVDAWFVLSAVEFTLAEDTADVDDAGAESVVLVDAVNSPFPELAAPPAPAPDDDPAVFDATVVGAVATDVDCM